MELFFIIVKGNYLIFIIVKGNYLIFIIVKGDYLIFIIVKDNYFNPYYSNIKLNRKDSSYEAENIKQDKNRVNPWCLGHIIKEKRRQSFLPLPSCTCAGRQFKLDFVSNLPSLIKILLTWA